MKKLKTLLALVLAFVVSAGNIVLLGSNEAYAAEGDKWNLTSYNEADMSGEYVLMIEDDYDVLYYLYSSNRSEDLEPDYWDSDFGTEPAEGSFTEGTDIDQTVTIQFNKTDGGYKIYNAALDKFLTVNEDDDYVYDAEENATVFGVEEGTTSDTLALYYEKDGKKFYVQADDSGMYEFDDIVSSSEKNAQCSFWFYKKEAPEVEEPAVVDISNCAVTIGGKSSFQTTFTGKAAEPKVTVAGVDAANYDVTYANNVNAGTAKVTITAKGDGYTGSIEKSFTINKAANPMTAKTKALKFKAKTVKKKAQSVNASKAFTVKNAKGKVSYAKASGNKKITVSKAGKITVKKGLKKGTYKVKVKVSAAGSANYKAGKKTVTVTIKVK